MKAFPHLVEMHKKLADKGLVIIAVSVDDPAEEELVQAANRFLKDKNPPFTKLLLNESAERWNKKLDFTIPPCYYLFDRNGQWVRFRAADYDDDDNYYERMDKLILRMLDEK